MEQETAAFVYKIAPKDLPGKWRQIGIKRTLDQWETERPDEFESVLDSDDFGYIVGFRITRTGVGQYGYDTGFRFVPDIETEYLEEVEWAHLVEPFVQDWVQNICESVHETQERTSFSAKEFAAFIAHRNPFRSETQNADALGISVGTYRGKIGRVKNKLNSAQATLDLNDAVTIGDDPDEWVRESFSAPRSVIHRVDEERLPIRAVSGIQHDDIELDDLPVEKLIQE